MSQLQALWRLHEKQRWQAYIPYEFTICDFSCRAKSLFAYSILVLAKWHFALHFVICALVRYSTDGKLGGY